MHEPEITITAMSLVDPGVRGEGPILVANFVVKFRSFSVVGSLSIADDATGKPRADVQIRDAIAVEAEAA